MRWKPYPKYRASGVEWLGDVPEHWDVQTLRSVSSTNDEVLPETTDPEFELAYVDISSVNAERGIIAVEEMSFDKAPSRARRLVRDGDTIVSTVRTYLKAIAPIRAPQKNLVVSTGFAVVRPRTCAAGYLTYALREAGFVEAIVARSVGVSYPAVNTSELVGIPIPLPTEGEQQAIAHFLDAQIARLDTLIAKKHALTDNLKEKRTALISSTVTRGLPPGAARAAGFDPHPQLKPSGSEWIGEVPDRWLVIRLRHVLKRIEQGWSPECEARQADEDEWGVLKVGCVNGNEFDPLEHKALPSSMEPLPEYEIQPGDILMSRANTAELLGNTVLVRTTRPRLLLCDKLYRLDVSDVDKEYLTILLNSPAARYQYERDATGASSSMKNIGQDTVRNLVFALPPLAEQRAIASFLHGQTSRIDRLVARVEAAIERLRDYRTALITAAVTGKIDVRGFAA